jgi:orotidine-5'-phosphate decarboxylase
MNSDPRVIVALDFPDSTSAMQLVEQLDPGLCRLKVGKELFTAVGPQFVEQLQGKGFEVFLDLKFHDIPNTVAKACEAAAHLGVWMVNVHALGGRKMMEAASEAMAKFSRAPKLIAVTILTSMGDEELQEIHLQGTPQDNVEHLARLAQSAGLDGVVCSPREASVLREKLGDLFVLVTPGVRPAGASADDQKRIMTPRQAIDAGSTYLVIGRPITKAPDPLEALRVICTELM